MKNSDNALRQCLLFVFGIVLKLAIVTFVICGAVQTFGYRGFMGGGGAILYFTIQSNLAIGLVALAFAVINIIEVFCHKKIINNVLLKIKFVFTIAITITGLVFVALLAPRLDPASLFTFSNISLHVVVPIFALIDFFLFDYNLKTTKKDCLLAIPIPLYYLIFALVISTQGIEFYNGSNVPYFFLDYTKYGWFNASIDGLGVAYWIAILSVAIIALAALLLLIKNAISKKALKKQSKKHV